MVVWMALAGCGGPVQVLDTKQATVDLEIGRFEGRAYGSYNSYEHMVRAEILATRGDFEGAADEMEEALFSDPDDFLLRTKYAEILMNLGEYGRAKRHLARAVLIEPTAEVAWLALARLYAAMGEEVMAVDAARHGLRVEPWGVESAMWLADHYRHGGDLKKAVELYRKVLAAEPHNLGALKALGEIADEVGDHEEAVDRLTLYMELGGGETSALARLARVHLKVGATEKGIDFLGAAVRMDPEDTEVRRELIGALHGAGLADRVVRHVRSLPILSHGDVEGAAQRAAWLEQAGQPYEARSLLVACAGRSPRDPGARLALAEIEMTLGRIETARLLLEGGAVVWPEDFMERVGQLLEIIDQSKTGGEK
jgi:tetratricopeptide (TPR) repeat protein